MKQLQEIQQELYFHSKELSFHIAINVYRDDLNVEDILKLFVRFVFVILLFLTFFQHMKRVINYYLPSAQFRLSRGIIYLN